MTESVEARSLSALNFLAANPPQYPINPTEEPHEPVVLYISRVPGSRDIILSTFKPQRKVVTGEDVANSLYYVHLDVLEDDLLAAPRPILLPDSERRSSGESFRSPIHRKPLPSAATAPVADANNTPIEAPIAVSTTSSQYTATLSERAPPRFNTYGAATPPRDVINPPLPPRAAPMPPVSTMTPIVRKPLGPRPMEPPLTVDYGFPPPSSTNAPSSTAQDLDVSRMDRLAAPSAAYVPSRTPSPSKRGHERSNFIPFTLTIIRRDPSSGHQWNIGKVSSLQTDSAPWDDDGEGLPHGTIHDQRGQPTINVHLDTSGYAKFRGMPTRGSVEAYRPPSASSLPRSMHTFDSGPGSENPSRLAQATGEGFSRQVAMSYSKNWASNIKGAFRRRDRSRSVEEEEPTPAMDDLRPPERQPGVHQRQSSTHSIGSADSRDSDELKDSQGSPPPITRPGPGLKPRGYVFTSPWDSQCEFRTGNGGRSLKLRHVVKANSAGFNPLVATQNLRDGNMRRPGGGAHGRHGSLSATISGTVPVSELRFNLPSSDLFKTSSSPRERSGVDLPGQLHRLLRFDSEHQDHSDEDDFPDELESPLDAGLGRERAGGGNRGKRAKLGKLIVYNDGLKMLDLVVAANMGVWWGAWERSF